MGDPDAVEMRQAGCDFVRPFDEPVAIGRLKGERGGRIDRRFSKDQDGAALIRLAEQLHQFRTGAGEMEPAHIQFPLQQGIEFQQAQHLRAAGTEIRPFACVHEFGFQKVQSVWIHLSGWVVWIVSESQGGSHLRWVLQQVRQRVAVQHGKKCRRRFVQDASQSARGKHPARLIGPVHAVDHPVRFLAEADNVAEPDIFRWSCQCKAPANAALGLEISAAPEIMDHFDQMMP